MTIREKVKVRFYLLVTIMIRILKQNTYSWLARSW